MTDKKNSISGWSSSEEGPCRCICHDLVALHFMPCCAYTYVPRAKAEEAAAKLRAEKEKGEQKEELKKPEEWEKELGYKIMDPDGWRQERISWDQPITKEKFNKLAIQSTMRLAGKNKKDS